MVSTQARLLAVILVFISSSSSSSHAQIIPRVTFPLDSPGRPFTIFSLPDVSNTTTLLLSADEETLFVGARDAILSLNISKSGSLQLNKKIDWSPTESNVKECSMKGTDKADCWNFVRVLQVLNSTHMFACGTFAFSPLCSYISSETFSLVTNPSGKPEEGRGRCPYNPYHKNTAITVDGELYTATVADYRGNHPVISRHLSEGDHVDMKLDDTQGWLEEPTFISSTHIQSEGKVYFFFSELGREYEFIEKFTVSRVAQVCTSDVGGQRTLQRRWTTFTKAQLLCKANGELPYNVLQDMTTLRPAEGDSDDNTLFYGIFSSQWSGNSGRSAVCVFNLKTVKAAFAGSYKQLNRDMLKWSSRRQEKIANPGECGLHNASDTALRFIKENFLADQSVSPGGQGPALVSSDRRYSNIAAQRVDGAGGRKYTVLYLLTESGFLHKAVLVGGGAHIIEEIQVLRQPQRVRSLLLSVSQGAVLVGSSEGVASVPVSSCSHYRTCAECVLARDPFCAWDSTRQVCALVSSIKDQAGQDVEGGNVSKVCSSFTTLIPRGRSIATNASPSVQHVPVSLDEVVHLCCTSESQLARLHWERLGGELSSIIYFEKNLNLSFLATPRTLGRYACKATENDFTQTLGVYDVVQKEVSTLQPPSTSTSTPTRIPEIPEIDPTTPAMAEETPEAPDDEEEEKQPEMNPEKTTPRMSVTKVMLGSGHDAPADGSINMLQRDNGVSYLKELVAVSVLLAMCICALVLLAAYILRLSFHSRTAPHLPWLRRDTATTEGGTDQERASLKGESPQQEKQKSPFDSKSMSNGSNGHLPNIPI